MRQGRGCGGDGRKRKNVTGRLMKSIEITHGATTRGRTPFVFFCTANMEHVEESSVKDMKRF